jgi:hypothetical protein
MSRWQVRAGDFAGRWREIAAVFLRLGITPYGGPTIMGIMQAELQERRQWVPKERFIDGYKVAASPARRSPRPRSSCRPSPSCC